MNGKQRDWSSLRNKNGVKMADYKRGRALKQLQLLPQENKRSGERGEKRRTRKEMEHKRKGGTLATGKLELNWCRMLSFSFVLPQLALGEKTET